MQRSFKSRLEALEALEAEPDEPELTQYELERLLDHILATVAAGEAEEVADLLQIGVLLALKPVPYGLHGLPAFLEICACAKCRRMVGWNALHEVYR